ncbi:cysteine desulfurase-like protein [Dactylosporangium sp. NBC_01737]|uniref:cysteine desulfurase-like protein n=1 Tax=Dactylosporangium sp. NBC_01737 TaxID=2975959 RepID=UPI002E0DB7A5|nr:cysteine desulfurase-like protein [Dactylosporangium sp. NBC_01737]
MSFDVARARRAYPALAEGFVHFDGAAGTLVAEPVARAVAGVLGGAVSNRTTAFEPGRRALRIVEQARAAVGDLLGADPAGVVFGPSATALTYTVARGLAEQWQPGDNVVVTRLDHDANVRPWVQLAARAGVEVRWAAFDPATGALPTDVFGPLVDGRTRVVAVTAASNAIGTRPDVAAIAGIAHEAGAVVYVDGVHATAHLPVDVAALGADYYVTSAYKWSGPHLAACAATPQQWERTAMLKLLPSPDAVPERFELGTPSFELLAGVEAAVDFIATLDDEASGSRRDRVLRSMAAVDAYEMDLFDRLLKGLRAVPSVRVLPAPEGGCPTVSFRVGDQNPARTAGLLGEQGICVFSGDYYAAEYFIAMGLRESGGAVRAGLYHYTTAEEVDRLVAAVAQVL